MSSQTWLTQEAADRLRAELENLEGPGRKDVTAKIEAARAEGDLKENGGYHAARDEQGKMEARIRQIDQVIRNHELVERDENAGTVQYASIVQIVYEGDSDDDFQDYFIGSIEEKPEDPSVLVSSPTSPLGKELLGKAIGEKVTYDAPAGKISVKIVGIR